MSDKDIDIPRSEVRRLLGGHIAAVWDELTDEEKRSVLEFHLAEEIRKIERPPKERDKGQLPW